MNFKLLIKFKLSCLTLNNSFALPTKYFLYLFCYEAIAATIATSTTSAITIITTEPMPKWAHALKSCPSTFICMPEGAVETIVVDEKVVDVVCSSMNFMLSLGTILLVT